mgnify:FL=1
MKTKVFYEELLPHEFTEKIQACPVAYLPLGTLEYHGKHLPLGADFIQSSGLFQLIAEEFGGIVLPPLFLGPDFRHTVDEESQTHYYGMDVGSVHRDGVLIDYPDQQLPGSAYYVEEEFFKLLLEKILFQLHRPGFRIVVAHGHGPSSKLFSSMKEELLQKTGIRCIDCLSDAAGTPLPFQNDHAGANETSITMAVRPDLVDLSVYDAEPEQKPIAVIGADPRFFSSSGKGENCLRVTADAVIHKINCALQQSA